MPKMNFTPILTKAIQSYLDYFAGWNEKDQSRIPTLMEKQQMIRYPVIASIIQAVYYPLLSANISIKGDPEQENLIKHWFDRYYFKSFQQLLNKAVSFGFAVGEKVYNTIQLDNKNYWMLESIIAPEPYNCRLNFQEEPFTIKSFTYREYEIQRFDKKGNLAIPGMGYLSFRGDEICKPYGDSILNDMFWVWQLLMKTITSLTMYQRLHIPLWVLSYIPKESTDSEGNSTDLNRSTAIQTLKDAKNMSGMILPMQELADGTYGKGWTFEEVASQDKEPTYLETIKLFNSLLYIAALMPERIIEQHKETGSEAMVRTQLSFYDRNIIGSRLEELEGYLRNWFIEPMLMVNFGSIRCEVNLSQGSGIEEFYGKILLEMIRTGFPISLDVKALMQRLDIPISQAQPEVKPESKAEAKPLQEPKID